MQTRKTKMSFTLSATEPNASVVKSCSTWHWNCITQIRLRMLSSRHGARLRRIVTCIGPNQKNQPNLDLYLYLKSIFSQLLFKYIKDTENIPFMYISVSGSEIQNIGIGRNLAWGLSSLKFGAYISSTVPLLSRFINKQRLLEHVCLL